MEKEFLMKKMREKTPVRVIVINGFPVIGVIVDFDDQALLVECQGKRKMVYRHAISTIEPAN